MGFIQTIIDLFMESGLSYFFTSTEMLNLGFIQIPMGVGNLIMILVSFVLMYLAIVKGFEPLLLLPIAFGMFLANLPMTGITDASYEVVRNIASTAELAKGETVRYVMEQGQQVMQAVKVQNAGLIYYMYQGVQLGIYPPLIFLGIGTMTDFGPLIANPKSFLLGAAAQLGIFITFLGAMLLGFTAPEAGAIGIIGGADGPTAIYTASILAPQLLPSIAVAAYSYMALVPIIQPPIMKALTTKEERLIKMKQLRPVSKSEKIVFPIMVTLVVVLLIPSTGPLIGMLMLGNILRESGVTERLSKTAQNELMNIITIFLGVSVGSTATAKMFLTAQTLYIIVLGLVAFSIGTAGGTLFGRLMCKLSGGTLNPLIGSAGVSAVPMAARVAQKVGADEDPTNFLLMHAMGPNVSGVIGSAVAAGVLISVLRPLV